MPLLEIVDSLDGVHESIREDYEHIADGDHKGKFGLKIVRGLAANKAQVLAEKKKIEDALKAEQDKWKGIDPERARKLIEDAEKGDEDKARQTGNFDEFKTKWQKEVDEQAGALQKTIDEQAAELRRLKLTNQVKASFLAAGVFPDDVDDVLKITESRFDLDDKGQIVTKDKEGMASPHDLDKFTKEIFKAEKPKYYAPIGKGGSGAQQTTTTRKTGGADVSGLRPSEKLKIARRSGGK